MKTFGRVLLSFVPMLVFLIIQIAVSIGMTIILMAGNLFNDITKGTNSLDMMFSNEFIEYVMLITLVAGIVSTFVFGLWYYLYLKKPKLENPIQIISGKSILIIIALCLGLYALVDLFLSFVNTMNPIVMDEYMDLMDGAGVGELNLTAILAVVVFAPIYEELIFRGLTFKMAQKFTSKFWVANIFQALLFGIVHMNLVQGTYAFVLGIILGLVYRKYQTIYIPILMHMVFNFLGSVVTQTVFSKITTDWGWWLFFIGSVAIGIVGIIFFVKDKGRVIIKEDIDHNLQA